MAESALPPKEILTLLSEHPPRLAALTTGLAPSLLRTRPSENEWSAIEVLAHLRSCSDVWGDCMVAILSQDKPTLRAINPWTWLKRTNYLDLEFNPSLRAYTVQRKKLLALLEPIPSKSWSRSATVTGAGKPLVRTVHSYAQWLAKHERPHVKQIARIVQAVRA